MESLPKTIPVLAFKITVCQKFLSSSPSAAGAPKPRPRPLQRRGPRRDSGPISSTTDVEAERTGYNLPLRTQLTTFSEVFQLLCSNHNAHTSASVPPILSIKYTLLMSYAHIQGLLPPSERDGDWQDSDAPVNGRWKQVIDTAFPSESSYHRALTTITSFWPAEVWK
ncbi:hypothetical protein JVU11DRAFT_2419 [Chiua virens]|nr:hypothetical protein JVU11DRAFT_2419 [Chiua virens]